MEWFEGAAALNLSTGGAGGKGEKTQDTPHFCREKETRQITVLSSVKVAGTRFSSAFASIPAGVCTELKSWEGQDV